MKEQLSRLEKSAASSILPYFVSFGYTMVNWVNNNYGYTDEKLISDSRRKAIDIESFVPGEDESLATAESRF